MNTLRARYKNHLSLGYVKECSFAPDPQKTVSTSGRCSVQEAR